jgi:hypothetical protein
MQPETTSADNRTAPAARPHRFWRRLFWVLGIGLVLLAILVALAPTILSMGALRGAVLSAVGTRIPAKVEAEGLSLSWFGSQKVQGLVVQSADGQPAAKLTEVALEQGLLNLLRHTDQIGEVRLAGGEVWIAGLQKVAHDATAGKPPKPREPSDKTPPTLPAKVTLDHVILHSRASNLEIKSGEFVAAPEAGKPNLKVNWELTGTPPATGPEAPGFGELTASFDGLTSDWQGWDAVGVTSHLSFTDLPMRAVWGELAPLGVGLTGTGFFGHTELDVTRTRQGAVTAKTDITLREPTVSGDFLKGDHPALHSVHVAGTVAYDKGRLDVTSLQMDSDFANAKADGWINLAGESPDGSGTVWVQVKLAQAAYELPNTLQIQKGLTVKSGVVEGNLSVAVTEKPGTKDRVATLKVTGSMKDVEAVRNNQTLALSPIQLAAQVERTYDPAAPAAKGPEYLTEVLRSLNVANLSVSGPFGNVAARGRMESFSLDAQLDLTAASREIGQFVDLSGYQARGQATVSLTSSGDMASSVKVTAGAQMTDLVVDLGQGRRWSEDQMRLDVAGGLVFGPDHGVTGGSLEKLVFRGSSAALSVAGTAARGEGGWTYSGTAAGNGSAAWLVGLSDLVDGTTGPSVEPWRQTVHDAALALHDPRNKEVPGHWQFEGRTANDGKTLDATVKLQLADMAIAPPDKPATDIILSKGLVDCSVKHTAGSPWQMTLRDVQISAREATSKEGLPVSTQDTIMLKAKGDLAIGEDWKAASLTGNLSAETVVYLAWLSDSLVAFDYLPKDYSAIGLLRAGVQAKLDPAGPRTVSFNVMADNLQAQLGAGRMLSEPALAVTGRAAFVLDAATNSLTSLTSDAWTLKASAGELAGTGSLARDGTGWAYTATAAGQGEVVPLMATLSALADVKATSADGRWKIEKAAIAIDSKGQSADVLVSASDVELTVPGKLPGPLHMRSALVDGAFKRVAGSPWQVSIRDVQFLATEATLKAKGDLVIPANNDVAGAAGTLTAEAGGDLAWISGTLKTLGYWPQDYAVAGTAAATVTASTDAQGRRAAGVNVTVANLLAQLPGKGSINEDKIALTVKATGQPDAAGGLASAAVDMWALKASAGQLAGTAALTHTGTAWTYDVAASGEGDVQALALTVASLSGGQASQITGHWKIEKGRFATDSKGQAVELLASATDLATVMAAAEGKPAATVRLADVSVDAAAVVTADRQLTVSRATVRGPGLEAQFTGSATLPAKDGDAVIAQGQVKTLTADLAQLSSLLKPFGLLPANMQLAGAATLTEAKVATDAGGVVTGGGVLDIQKLDVRTGGDGGFTLQEPAVHLPINIICEPREKRLAVSLDGLKSSLATGSLHGSYAWGGKDPLIDFQCDVESDGQRLTAAVVQPFAKDLALTGPVHLKASATGPLPAAGTWAQRIGGLAGGGDLEINQFTLEQIVVDKASLRWLMKDRQLTIGDASGPGRMTLAGGTVNLAGRVDLRGEVPHFIIDTPLALVQNASILAPGIKEHLKYTNTFFGEAKLLSGRLSVTIDSLDLPLDKAQRNLATGRGKYQVDDFQADMGGAMGEIMARVSGQARTPLQRYGPVSLTLEKGILTIPAHTLALSADTNLKMNGKIGLDGSINFVAAMPMSARFLTGFGANATALKALQGQELAFPMTGTVDKVQIDQKEVGKRVGEMILKAAGRAFLENGLKGFLK